MQTMLTYINEEQDILNNIIINFNNIDITKYQSIGIIATGSSINAAQSCIYFLQDILNKKIDIYEAYSFSNFTNRIDHDLYILISQSGESKSVIDVLYYLKQKSNSKILTISNNKKSQLAIKSDMFLDINAGEEKVGFVTKGFSATLLNLILLGIYNSKKYEYIEKFKCILNKLNMLTEEVDKYIFNNKKIFENTNRYMAVSYNNLFGIAKEFETKFTETVRCPSTGYELEAFMHGPYLECNEKTLIFFLNSNDIHYERAKNLEIYLKKYVYETIDLKIFIDDFEKYSNIELTIFYALIIQLMSFRVAEIKNINLSEKIFVDFDEKLGSKVNAEI